MLRRLRRCLPPFCLYCQLPTAAALLQFEKSLRYTTHPPFGELRISAQDAIERREAIQNVRPAPFVQDNDVAQFHASISQLYTDPLASASTSVAVDIRLLGNIRITAAEIIAFFPNHVLKWDDALYRLIQNGWTTNDISGYFNYTRQLSGDATLTKGMVSDRVKRSNLYILGRSMGSASGRPRFKTAFFTTKGWVLPQAAKGGVYGHPIDHFLVDLAEGLVNWPRGSGARLLTRAVEFAVRHGYRHVKLSQFHNFVHAYQINLPLLPPMATRGLAGGVHPDTIVKEELQDVIARDLERQPVGRRKR